MRVAGFVSTWLPFCLSGGSGAARSSAKTDRTGVVLFHSDDVGCT
jgi:hypothetical protein